MSIGYKMLKTFTAHFEKDLIVVLKFSFVTLVLNLLLFFVEISNLKKRKRVLPNNTL